jgi:nitroreductase
LQLLARREAMLSTMEKRRSVRSYLDEPLSTAVKVRIDELLRATGQGVFGFAPRFALVERSVAHAKRGVKLGTYGFIKGARYFVAGAVSQGEMAEVDYGCALERIILELTALGLGTCWLGGTFSRKDYGQLLEVAATEFVPAVTPVGYAAEKRGLVERMVRWGAKSDGRMPFEQLFFKGDFSTPLSVADAGRGAPVLEAVRRGPSASNKQPWRVVLREGQWHLYLVRTPGYARMLKAADLQLVDMGIAMCHFALAAKAVKLPGRWQVKDPGLEMPELGQYIVTWGAL